ncbi:MAG: uroporphyrinogen-III synthase [Candidatus Dormibacteria bacterium]
MTISNPASARLQGLRVLVTRAQDQAQALSTLLEAEGASPVSIPVMRLHPLLSESRLEELRRSLREGGFDDLVFTSANAVRLLLAGVPAEARPSLRVFAIGPGTAASLRALGWRAEELPQGFIAESLAASIVALGVAGRRLLLPRAQGAREVLPELLERAGASVEVVSLYRMQPELAAQASLQLALRQGDLDWATFTSGSSVDCFLELAQDVPLPPQCAVACIGPITAAALRRARIEPQVVAPTHSMEGLVEALAASQARLLENGRRP